MAPADLGRCQAILTNKPATYSEPNQPQPRVAGNGHCGNLSDQSAYMHFCDYPEREGG